MTWSIRVTPDAERELEAEARWHDEHTSLRAELVAALDSALHAIAEGPLRWPVWAPGSPYRKYVVSRLPYLVIYRVLRDYVEILAFAHTRRRPGYWLSR